MGEETLTYTSNKDGTLSVKDSEGKEVRYAKESDLLAVKGSAEAAEKNAKLSQEEISKALEASKAEAATANTQFAETNQKLLQAEAQAQTLKEEVEKNAGSAVELATAKKALEDANKSVEELNTKALEYRKNIIVATFGVSADTVKDKTMEQLDYFEEALKAVATTKGVGNLALGGGGTGATPETPIERAKATIAAAMERRNKGFLTGEE